MATGKLGVWDSASFATLASYAAGCHELVAPKRATREGGSSQSILL
jgi:hypothetical protein